MRRGRAPSQSSIRGEYGIQQRNESPCDDFAGLGVKPVDSPTRWQETADARLTRK